LLYKILLTVLLALFIHGCSDDADKKFDLEENSSIQKNTLIEVALEQFEINKITVGNDWNIIVEFSNDLAPNNDYNSLVGINGIDKLSFSAYANKLTIKSSVQSYDKHILTLHKAIRDADNQQLSDNVSQEILFAQRNPSIKFTGKGVILPNSRYLEIPIEVSNVQAIHLRAFKVFKNNIGQFLQNNTITESEEIKKVGRLLWDKKIPMKDLKANDKQILSLDVTDLLENENGSLIQLTAYIDRSDSLYECSAEDSAIPVIPRSFSKDLDSADYSQSSGWDFADNSFAYSERTNPCKDAYYHTSSETTSVRNLLKSNIGLIAKFDSNEDELYVAATNIETAQTLPNINIEVYNFQNQLIGKNITDEFGIAKIKVAGIPYYLQAKRRKDIGYLKLSNSSSLPTSQFDVSGVHVTNEVNGYIYGERDVWRPGDQIFLTFVLGDIKNKLPKDYPVKMDLFDPSGQLTMSKTNNTPSGTMYSFAMKTDAVSKTGKWKAIAYVGNQKFSKDLSIETIVPNRLKIEMKVNKDTLNLNDKDLEGELFAQWLHGAKASTLKAEVELRTKSVKTSLGGYADYEFDDVTRDFQGDKQEILSDKLDKEGVIKFPIKIDLNNEPSGMMKAYFTSKVYEEGGDFSSNVQNFILHPYQEYVGIKLPKGDETRGMLLTDKEHPVDIVVVDTKGKPLPNKNVHLTFHKITWKWWWDKTEESLAKYASSSSYDILDTADVTTDKDGKAQWKINIKYPDWGRYLVRACDKDSKHCSSKIVYLDWPGWAGRAVEQNTNSVARLTLASDKAEYQVGETAIISLPKSNDAKLLVSLESGANILKQYWIDSKSEQLEVPITSDMAPNTYVTVSLIQPHKDRQNDRPIRLMGILNLTVKDSSTFLYPAISMEDEVRPASKFKVTVSEKNGSSMNYSLAVVDEGLLGLTNYQTPSLHNHFYKRKGLQVKTWDLYDEVVGAYSGDLERMLDIGGSDSAKEEEKGKKNRFKPVVRYLGTFTLDKNNQKVHEVTLPNYIGSVRVMVVAAQGKKYGKADKSVFVRSPISILTTLPRMLNVNEEISLPVDVFVMKDGIKNVNVSVEAESDYFETIVKDTTLQFNEMGEQIAQLKIKTKNKIGKAKILVTAKSQNFISTKEVYIDIGSPNIETYKSISKRLAPDEEWNLKYIGHGILGTNKTHLEFSTVAPMNLENRLNGLITYPHGCVEQTTSSVFPQLYLGSLINLITQRQDEIQSNVEAAIMRLQSFQTVSGGFSYWPSENNAHPWGTNYVMHFLIEAKNKGYKVPTAMLNNVIDYQKKEAKKLVASSEEFTKNQAYRLFNLALVNQADMSAMYRLKEDRSISNTSKWLLAAAYSKIGQKEVANTLTTSEVVYSVNNIANDVTFASNLREEAMMLMCADILKKYSFADNLANRISEKISSDEWISTQATSYSLLAMSKYSMNTKEASLSYSVNNEEMKIVNLDKPFYKSELKNEIDNVNISFKNNGKNPITVLIGNKGIPEAGNEEDLNNNVSLSVLYFDKDGNTIDPSKLIQGTNFSVKLSVQNLSPSPISNMVLSYKVASGWQIHNERLSGTDIASNIDYQDIRDDRVHTYFKLGSGETKEFKFYLNASYIGEYYLPVVKVESMYDNKISALKKGMKVEVTK
jgi:alpha-2-macroglobulin